ncbi:MAG: type II toxin-antitoxin system RelB/DinJ family antitoxin [Sulfurimonas sp.]
MIASKVRTNVYLDSEMKAKAKDIFKHYGVSLSDAINMFLTQSVMERGLPFELKIPNDETIRAIEDARASINGDSITMEELEKESSQCLQ